jgi:hypothetical protein
MINNTEINQNSEFNQEGNIPLNEAQEDTSSFGKLKSYGKKSLSPLVELVHKYQDEVSPYFEAILKGLQGGVNSLDEGSSNDAEKVVSGWFKEAFHGLNEAKSKLESSNAEEMIVYIEDKAQRHPGFMFSTSYLTGLFFGRVGRHIGRKKAQEKKSDYTMKH